MADEGIHESLPEEAIETGHFTITVGLDSDGKRATSFDYDGISPFEAVGLLIGAADRLRHIIRSRWQ